MAYWLNLPDPQNPSKALERKFHNQNVFVWVQYDAENTTSEIMRLRYIVGVSKKVITDESTVLETENKTTPYFYFNQSKPNWGNYFNSSDNTLKDGAALTEINGYTALISISNPCLLQDPEPSLNNKYTSPGYNYYVTSKDLTININNGSSIAKGTVVGKCSLTSSAGESSWTNIKVSGVVKQEIHTLMVIYKKKIVLHQ